MYENSIPYSNEKEAKRSKIDFRSFGMFVLNLNDNPLLDYSGFLIYSIVKNKGK